MLRGDIKDGPDYLVDQKALRIHHGASLAGLQESLFNDVASVIQASLEQLQGVPPEFEAIRGMLFGDIGDRQNKRATIYNLFTIGNLFHLSSD